MYANPRTGAWLRPLETSTERMAVERLMKPHSGKADAPIALQKPVIAAAAALGRLRGYKPRYDLRP